MKTPDQKLPELFIFPLGPNSVFKRRIKSIRKRIRLQIKHKTNKRKYNKKKSNQSEVMRSKKKSFISSREMRFKKRSSKQYQNFKLFYILIYEQYINMTILISIEIK